MNEPPTFDQLVALVERQEPSGDPLARLAKAAQVRDGLDTLVDALLDHFVESARSSDSSWSDIGGALGVSARALQQRHAMQRLEVHRYKGLLQFGSAARETVAQAGIEARDLGNSSVGSEHLLLGVLAVGGVAAEALTSCNVDYERMRRHVANLSSPAARSASGHTSFTLRAKKIFTMALRESLGGESNEIGPEHLLLAIAREGESTAMQTLTALGVDAPQLREAVLDRFE